MEIRGRVISQSTPKFAQQVSDKYANLGSRKVQSDLRNNHGRKVSRTYIQKISDAVGTQVYLQEQEQDIKWRYRLPKAVLSAHSVNYGMDGTTSYVVKEGYRETMNGTISFHDKEGERLHTIYIAQTPEYGKASFKERFTAQIEEVKRILDKTNPNCVYTAIADGAKDIWAFFTKTTPYLAYQTLDYWHATEYLTDVSKVTHTTVKEQSLWLEKAKISLRQKENGAQELLTQMIDLKQMYEKGKKLNDKITNLDLHHLNRSITYFSNNIDKMNYSICKSKHLPIGSGVTEAACKVIVKERLCCSGMMWTNHNAQNVLNIRCLTHTDGRWMQFWGNVDKFGILNYTSN